MKTTTFFVLSLLLVASLPCFGLNYTITFTGTGASSTVDNVIVQNLTKGTTVTVPAGNVLNLSDAATAVEPLSANDEAIRVYPASAGGKSRVSFFSKQAGGTQLSAFSLDGRKVAGISTDLQAGSNTFELSLPKGVFVIQVTGNEYAYTAKMLNPSGTLSKPEIVYTGTEKPASSSPQKTKSSTSGITAMTYATGDQLLYKATSGTYNTIVTDVPTGSKTTNFNFVACTDADGNNYKVVTIGTQTWMAENLKTTQYNDGTAIQLVTNNTSWLNLSTPAYCWYNNDAATYKNKYGALYNWYTVNNGKLAPTGWHVATDEEWTTLENYLIANGYNYDGSTQGDYYAKSLAATTDWAIDTYTDAGAIGTDLSKNNRSGFSALPGGDRGSSNGSFYDVGDNGYWWSSTESNTYDAWYRDMYYGNSSVYRNGSDKQNGFSVRCVRDSQ
jgi:uncharacterized protein (TIGR02145 family)